ncbi:vanillyl alcohol oxidase [Aaosphaeria arxii CBS 175.79]|uniref:Vanillyl alcohol oxidase n=1 Tax=Aaosphaeria arxii CBS 175.79 TaxID=1450172 RepID=A0A6A5XRJ7_9PLEO|nr:vanillyl alcohol oxidase [Aaosphaeria arxii CBS 175.79]KAF2015802.1 vanillyl alcohol oxidase [Aaosphaeria arxii CBS 175.79]
MPPPINHTPAYTNPEYQTTHLTLFKQSITTPLKSVLPPGVTRYAFEAAILQYMVVVGHEQVLQGDALAEYIDPYELREAEGKRKMPSAAVRPKSVEELREILRISNEFDVPVWTFSRGKNLGYGGPAPRANGSVALDLHRMNKIIEVSADYAYAVVEPGVTFTELYEYCTEHKLTVWPSVPSLGWGSVVGNTVDRGTGFTPTATHHQHICGVEVMLADGDLVRTGQFAVSGSPSSHLSKFTFGPSIEGLFLQSNLGIVTKLGIWLTPAPQAFMSCSFDMPDLEDVETIVDVFGPLRRDGLLPNTVYVSNLVEWLGMMGKREDLWPHDGPIPESRLREFQKELDIGYWNAKFGLYGARDVVQAHFDELKKIVGLKAPKGRLTGNMFAAEDGHTLDPASLPEPHGGFFVGVPSLWSLPMVKFRLPKDGGGIGAHYDYSPIVPSSGKTVLEWVKTAKKICEAESFDLFCDFFMHERHVIFVNMMTFDKTNPSHIRAVETIFQNLFAEGKKRGFSKYRSHVNAMDQVASLYDFNDHAYRRFVERIKDALDPKGILSPGKQGIWPRRFRENEALKAHL